MKCEGSVGTLQWNSFAIVNIFLFLEGKLIQKSVFKEENHIDDDFNLNWNENDETNWNESKREEKRDDDSDDNNDYDTIRSDIHKSNIVVRINFYNKTSTV